MHGDDRHLPSLHNPFEAATERQQRTGAGNLSFREDADDLPVVQCGAYVTQGSQDDTRSLAGRDRDDAQGFHERPEQWILRVPGIHHKTDRAVQTRHQQEPVHEGHMVRYQQRRSLSWHGLASDDGQAIDEAGQQHNRESKETVW